MVAGSFDGEGGAGGKKSGPNSCVEGCNVESTEEISRGGAYCGCGAGGGVDGVRASGDLTISRSRLTSPTASAVCGSARAARASGERSGGSGANAQRACGDARGTRRTDAASRSRYWLRCICRRRAQRCASRAMAPMAGFAPMAPVGWGPQDAPPGAGWYSPEDLSRLRKEVQDARESVNKLKAQMAAAKAELSSSATKAQLDEAQHAMATYKAAQANYAAALHEYNELLWQEKQDAHESDRSFHTGHFMGRYDDWGPRFVIVTKNSEGVTMSGSEEDAEHAKSLKSKIPGDFIWFERDEKPYIIRDQATVDRAKKFWEPEEELGKKQEALGKQQEELGRQQEALGKKMEEVRVKIPDMTADMQALMAKMKELSANGGTQEEIGDLQSQIGELQSKVGEIQSDAGRQQSEIGRQQGELGRKQGELGPPTRRTRKATGRAFAASLAADEGASR